MVLAILIIIAMIILWLLSLKFAEKIGTAFINNVVNPIVKLFKK